MIFSQKIYLPNDIVQLILTGKKVQTRRMVKEGEFLSYEEAVTEEEFKRELKYGKPAQVITKNKKIKWQTCKEYSVCLGRGKPCVWYCPECKSYGDSVIHDFHKVKGCSPNHYCYKCERSSRLLKIRITGIRKEHLKDITEEDAEREGFVSNIADINKNNAKEYGTAKNYFLAAFAKVNKDKIPKEVIDDYFEGIEEAVPEQGHNIIKNWTDCDGCSAGIAHVWNPEVWCLTFQKV